MIHIATVHWLDETWVDIQLEYFKKYLGEHPYRVYAFLNGIDPAKYRERIFFINTEPIVAHIAKLNWLAEYICKEADPEDIIYFIDGDAFPVGDIHGYVAHYLKEYPLVAVQRLENEGDPQPHPSFCATTVRFWKDIEGDWSKGPKWKTLDGRLRSDTGGVLWYRLNEKGIRWKPMLRSNRMNLHPLWFGVYEDLIYHHGAAFRTPYCMVDIREARRKFWKRWLMNFVDSPLVPTGKGWLRNAVYSFVMKNQIAQTMNNSSEVLAAVRRDFHFASRFTGAADERAR